MPKEKIRALSIVIPAYNEIETIEKIIKEVKSAKIGRIRKEIVIVDDGSSDGTREILEDYKNKRGFRIIFHEQNQGKSAAVRTGILETTGDLVIIQDADLEYDPGDYVKLLVPFQRGMADVVYGSRFKGNGPHRMIYFTNSLANKFLTFWSNLFTGFNLSDMETCYKMFDGDLIRDVATTLKATRFGFEPEVTAKISKRKARLFEVGIAYYGRSLEEGKKIRFKDGVKGIWEVVKYRFVD